ncbi:hypothetical protein HS088_TW04G00857 [Tripterygium wilfordii]|uniref:Pentatricopeptide repeat-containing protein n=1 Tax=Tripterygium wilfordii TaxID=458696 RepID=A0A7J7DRY7_TRIWF|nr:pentatricopeptide repeat-containing protein At3g02330, mitochondrial [Tripterygium wilfordii]KAF5748896.1 hypothetical protein HS088_TW04G00857 [Tripterygium wilfordii]
MPLKLLLNAKHISKISIIRLCATLPTKQIKTFSDIFQECSYRQALNPGKQAHSRMIVSGFTPTIFVTNCLIQLYIRCSSLDYAHKVFDERPQRDVVSWNAMISGYAGCGEMGIAREFFEQMPERDIVSWNSMISGYLQNCDNGKAVDVFVEMGKAGGAFDRATLAVVLKLCAVFEDCDLGIQVHCLAVKMGFDSDVVTASALLGMYAKCKNLDDSLCTFKEMPEKNSVSWSAIIAGCVQNNQFIKGFELFKEMQGAGIGVSQSIYASVLRSCAGLYALRLGTQLHCHAVKNGYRPDVIVSTSALDMYAKCGSILDAQKLFNWMPKHNLQSYNALITGLVRNNLGIEAIEFFKLLLKSGIGFDQISLSGAFSACAAIKRGVEGLQVHGLAVKSTLKSNVCVANAILDMYGKCGGMVEAFWVFDEMEQRDAVSWNAIIAAHEQNGYEGETLYLFAAMLLSRMEPDEFTYGSVLKACASREALNSGMEIHGRIIKSGMGLHAFVGGALVDMYCKCGMMEEAEKVHCRTEQQTTVSWNAIVSGFSLQNQSENGLTFFSQMLEEGVKPDRFTYAAVLDSCANLATAELGRQIHAHIIKLELQSDVYICSTLVDMYSKCGNMQDSQLMFEKAPKRDFVTWNALICGYAQHGLGEEALKIFEAMKLNNLKPNHATFVSVLRACAHMGLVKEGLHYFDTMQTDYGLDPQLEHYSCLVDIIGRSGQIAKALKLIEEMPFEADAVTWRTLLNICKLHGNVEVGEKAASCILQLEPQDSSAYILLSNIYADSGMWGGVSKMRKLMRHNELKKEPGCSWIEVKDQVHAFLVGDKAHPRRKEIYEKLGLLIGEMKWVGYVPSVDFLLDEEADEEEQQGDLQTCMHNL